jgi:hypothetical protein
MAGTPQIILFNPPGFTAEVNMYIFGRSLGEEHHLLAVDYEWPASAPATFLPPQRYEQTLSRSPAVSYTPGGQLLVAFQSKAGNKIQTYTAPYANNR